MGATITFDTLKFVKHLKAAGFNDLQAEALSEVQKESLTEIIEDRLATKKDLKETETALKGDIGRVEKDVSEIKSEQIKLTGEINLIKWMMGFVLAGITALVLKSFFV